MNRKTLQSLILALEAALIIVSLVTGSGTTVGMICYWSIAALNHLTDFVIRWIEEREERKEKPHGRNQNGLCNTGAVLVHAIDYAEDKILASINGENPEWCAMTEEYMEVTGETELGFTLGSFFIPLCEVMRFYSG